MITENKVVGIHYVLKDESGNILDASQGEPLHYLQGHQNIIPGLEKSLSGLQPGDKKQVQIEPNEGYGDYNPALKFSVPKDQFGGMMPEPGMTIQLSTPDGQPFMAKIDSISDQDVVLDANHPLAGRTLFFDVEVAEVRDATTEEIAHGHPHSGDDHHHH